MRFLIFLAVLLFPLSAAGQNDPWQLVVTICSGDAVVTSGANEFQLNLQGTPNVKVEEMTTRRLDCVTGSWSQTYPDLATCAPEATALQAEYDKVNALGKWDHTATCNAKGACDWLPTIYSGSMPADAQTWYDANCQGA